MPRIICKSFNLCFRSNLTNPSSPSDALSNDPNRPSIILNNNLNLLYDDSTAGRRLIDVVPSSTSTSTSTSTVANSSSSSASYNESDYYDFTPDYDFSPPDLAAVFASRRFFFASPGRSNLITGSPDLRSGDKFDISTRLVTGGTAVKHYVQSPDPYNDFRRSMQEMLDAVKNAGDFRRYELLHELLPSYLSLNETETHKFIIRAFADILVSLLSNGHRIS